MKIEKIEHEMTHWMFSFSGVLTIAVTWCPLSNACLTTSFPVLPVAPNTTNLNFLEGEISSPEAAMFDPYVTPLFPRPLSEWRRYHGDMGIPIPKTLVIWASPVTLTLIAKVIWEGDAHITSVLEMGMPISHDGGKNHPPTQTNPFDLAFREGQNRGKRHFFRDVLSYWRMHKGNYASPRDRDLVPRSGNAITLNEDGKIKPDFFNHCF